MSKEEVVDKVTKLKELCVKNQDFSVAIELRNIENAFTNSKHAKVRIEPTIENLKIELIKSIEYLKKTNDDKSQSVRHIKLLLLLNDI